MKSIKKNYIYNIIYQIFLLVISLVIAPYLSRKVGAEGVGIYSYTYSITNYFMLACLLGLNHYGNRTVAKVRENKEELSKTFLGIYAFQLLTSLLMIILYLIFIFFYKEYYRISLIQTIFILSALLDINWFFYGLEDFKRIITRSITVKIISLVFIFIFVKSPQDLWKYTLIMATATLFSQILLWPFLLKKIDIIKISKNDIVKHIKPNLILFIPVISSSIYKYMDKIMLGILSNVTEVGYYANAEKLVHFPVTFITTLGVIMLPRISNLAEKKKDKEIKEYIFKSVNVVSFLAFPMMIGIITVSRIFAPIFYGIEFIKSGNLMILLALTIPFIAFGNVIRTQYLLPKEKDKIYVKSIIMGAIINILSNLILIPIINSYGACIGTIFAEITVMMYQTISVRKELDIKTYLKSIIPFILKSLIMFIIIFPIKYLNINTIYILLIQVILGCLIYFILNYKYINNYLNIKNILIKNH